MNSPNLQHIIGNHLTININLSAFSYVNNSFFFFETVETGVLSETARGLR